MVLSTFFRTVVLGLFIVAFAGPAGAQQPEKRIALVVGNGAYAKAPLATAANDAGLVAQTLQAAGFDVVGARDLDGDSLRKSFRDFVQKAEGAGPGTVAMVYLSGYGVQLAGENYFIPVDAPVARDTDIPIEGLRLSDYLRELAALPLKTTIVVLDAARPQPFVQGSIASGLALVDPDPHTLIAFNAAPGTVAPDEPGPYGAYAQALAEMIRTGGLPLPELFDRVRLRVNDASKGAQVPWNAQKLDTPFLFFDRAPDAPAPPPDQTAALRDKPIRALGAQDAYAAAVDRDTLQGYDEFIEAYPRDPLAARVRAIVAARREAITWRRTYRADTPEAYWSYLRRYPRGPHAFDARRRLAILSAALEPPQSFAMIDYDVPPPPPDEIVYVDRPVLMFGDPDFDFAPPPPPPLFFLPPPPPDFVVLPPPPPPIGLFILPQPLFVPIPVYVRPPIYVAPPPNNIIFANIHNTTVINTVINRPVQPGPGGPNAPLVNGPGGRGPGGGGPLLPPSVQQRASLIQQGKAPLPPSASINPAIRTQAPGGPATAPGLRPNSSSQPANLGQPSQQLPKANALPVPGAKGGPPTPPSASIPGTQRPSLGTPPGGTPGTGVSPAGAGPKPGVAQQELNRGNQPGGGQPQFRRPGARSAPPTTLPASKPATPPAAVSRPPSPPQAAARSQPHPQFQAPAAYPQVHAPAQPRPEMRAAQPPRPAPPPQPQRAAPPPPRPAPPPRPPSPPRPQGQPAKKCPPNQPKC